MSHRRSSRETVLVEVMAAVFILVVILTLLVISHLGDAPHSGKDSKSITADKAISLLENADRFTMYTDGGRGSDYFVVDQATVAMSSDFNDVTKTSQEEDERKSLSTINGETIVNYDEITGAATVTDFMMKDHTEVFEDGVRNMDLIFGFIRKEDDRMVLEDTAGQDVGFVDSQEISGITGVFDMSGDKIWDVEHRGEQYDFVKVQGGESSVDALRVTSALSYIHAFE